MKLPKLTDFDFQGKKVLVRADLDVPLKEGIIEDDSRIREALPTIQYLLDHAAKVILLGHVGRPEGKVVEELKMAPIREKLTELLGSANFTLMENLRFDLGEESNDSEFARKLASLGDFYVNEAFATSHRAHASIVGVPKLLPHCAGLHFVKEVENLSKAIENPTKPLVVIIGGAKVESKLPVIERLFNKADIFLTGGVVANTLMVADDLHHKELGKSKIEEEMVSEARRILSLQEGRRTNLPGWGEIWKIKLPPDLIIADDKGDNRETVYFSGESGEVFNQSKIALDIGMGTVELYGKIINLAKTIIWSGPMGKYEDEKFAAGTRGVAEAVARSSAFKIVGGGDTITALTQFGLLDKMDYISTGGGAMLEFLAKGTLPGIEAILNSK